MTTEHSNMNGNRSMVGIAVLRLLLAGAMTLFAASASLAVTDDTLSRSVDFDIPPQSVETALLQFSSQADVQVMAGSTDVAGQRTNGVKGRLSAAIAMEELLHNTGLQYETLSEKTVAITRVASAQAESPAQPAVRTAAAASVPVSSDSRPAARGSLEEVVVTAQKRQERLQDVPIAVTAVSDVQLERLSIKDMGGLFGRVPSLYFSAPSSSIPRVGTRASPTIRGVTRRQFEPAVGIYIDDIYQPNLAFGEDFLDLERVEILRGPQGTLFGRNTLAGAIQMVTKKPSSTPSGNFMLEAKEFNSYRGKASVSGPLIDGKLAARLSAQGETTDGYLKNVARGEDQIDGDAGSARVAFLAAPSKSLEINFSMDYSESDRGVSFGVPAGCECYNTATDLDNRVESESYGGGLTINWTLPAFTLTSATGYRDSRQESDYDSDGDAFLTGNHQNFQDRDTFLSEELRLTSSGSDPWSWVVGAFAFESEAKRHRAWQVPDTTSVPEVEDIYAILDGLDLAYQNDIDRTGYALFGQASYLMMDNRLKLTAGGRYSVETARAHHDQYVWIPLLPTYHDEDFAYTTKKEEFSGFTPSGSISYRWNDDLTTYVTVAEGFLAGGFQRAPDFEASGHRPFNDELSTSYEIGAKGSLFDRRMTFGLALFHVDMKDLQVSVIRVINSVPNMVVDNAAEGESEGVEFETAIRLTDNLTFGGSVSYTDAKFTNFIDANDVDRSGEKFTNVPDWLGSLELEYVHSLRNDLELSFFGSYRYIGDVLLGSGFGDPFRDREAFDVVDASVSLSNSSWKLSLFVDNVLDDYSVVYSATGAFNVAMFEEPLAPRMVGVRFTRQW